MSKTALALVLATVFVYNSSFAELKLVPESVEATTGLRPWNKDFAAMISKLDRDGGLDAKKGYTECREVTEIKSAFLCQSYRQEQMNDALGRASFYIEGLGGNPRKNVVSQSFPNLLRYRTMIGGHDLKGKDLIEFYNDVQKKCEQGKEFCLNDNEKEIFTNFILPQAEKSENFVVITYAMVSRMRFDDVVTHEILHAQYFLESGFSEVVHDFWQTEVSAEHKKSVKLLLGRHYDSSIEELMINEFQAYMLMAGADDNLLGSLVPDYREKLMGALEIKHIKPIQVQ